MIDVMLWLRQQDLSVREMAAGLELPLKAVEDWVYRGVQPSPVNRVKLEDFMCTHHWFIDTANGHLSRGVCKLCHAAREFENSLVATNWQRTSFDTRRVSWLLQPGQPQGPADYQGVCAAGGLPGVALLVTLPERDD